MKIKVLNETLKNIDGDDLIYNVEKDIKLTLKHVCTNAMMSDFEKDMSGDAKLKAFTLAQKINTSNGEIELKAEEIATLKKAIAYSYPTLVTGQAFLLIEGSISKK